MNDKNDPHARLVAETFHDDWSEGPASEFALSAAAHARTRRTQRRSAVAGVALAMIASVLFFFARQHHHAPALAAPLASTVKSVPAYEIISDDELITLLRNRPLLILPQERADRRFVLLAQSTR